MATVVAVPADPDTVGIEAHVPREVRVVRIEGRRPVVTVEAYIEKIDTGPVTSGRKKYAVPVRAGHS